MKDSIAGLHVEDQAVPGCRACERRRYQVLTGLGELRAASKRRGGALSPRTIRLFDAQIADARANVESTRGLLADHLATHDARPADAA